MKKLVLAIAIMLFTLPSFGQKTIKYFKGDDVKFKAEMRSSSKAGFIFFTHEKSVEANTFETKVLHDTGVVKFIDSNLLALRINGPDYPYVVMSYGLDNLPAVVLFDRNGREIDRFYGYKDKLEFLKFLKQITE
jgi:thioredoxin-related protein